MKSDRSVSRRFRPTRSLDVLLRLREKLFPRFDQVFFREEGFLGNTVYGYKHSFLHERPHNSVD